MDGNALYSVLVYNFYTLPSVLEEAVDFCLLWLRLDLVINGAGYVTISVFERGTRTSWVAGVSSSSSSSRRTVPV